MDFKIQDGYDLLYKRTEDVLKSSQDIAHFFKKVAGVEEAYAKSLHKFVIKKVKKKHNSVQQTEMTYVFHTPIS